MRVHVKPPKGTKGPGFDREVTTGEQIDELERRGFTVWTDDGERLHTIEVAIKLKLGSTPRERQLDLLRDAIAERVDSALATLHADERALWLEQLLETIGRKRP